MTRFGLTHREKQLLDFIRECVAVNDVPPTYEEMARGIGLKAKSGISRLIHALEARGHIAFQFGHARSISLVPSTRSFSVDLPPEIYRRIKALAERSGFTMEVVLIEAARDGLSAFYARSCLPAETSPREGLERVA